MLGESAQAARLAVGPDDVLVLHLGQRLEPEQQACLRLAVASALADATPEPPVVLVLEPGLELSTLRLDQCPSDFVDDLVTKVARRVSDHLRLTPKQ